MSYRFVRGPRGYRGPQGYDGSIGQTGYTGSQGEIPEIPDSVMRTNIPKTMEQKIIQDQVVENEFQSRNIYISENEPQEILGNDGDIWIKYLTEYLTEVYGYVFDATGPKSNVTVSIQEM